MRAARAASAVREGVVKDALAEPRRAVPGPDCFGADGAARHGVATAVIRLFCAQTRSTSSRLASGAWQQGRYYLWAVVRDLKLVVLPLLWLLGFVEALPSVQDAAYRRTGGTVSVVGRAVSAVR